MACLGKRLERGAFLCVARFKFGFIELFFLCTFLSTVTEKYQKNTAKGLGALWTPVCSLWVCLTEDIHGGGFEKRSAKACGDAFLTPRQTHPKVGAACPSYQTMVFAAREGERVTPCLREGSRRSRACG